MPPKFYPTSGHLMICQGKNCQARNAGLLHKALWNYLEQESLAYYKQGGSVRLTESSCLGACSYGPALCVYRSKGGQLEQAWYAACDAPLTRQIAQAVHAGTELPTRGRYDLEQEKEQGQEQATQEQP